MDEPKLTTLAQKCAAFIKGAGDRAGVYPRDLAKYVGGFRDLGVDERFRVCVLICKQPGIAYVAEDEEFRYWPRAVAPEEAVRA